MRACEKSGPGADRDPLFHFQTTRRSVRYAFTAVTGAPAGFAPPFSTPSILH
jgi:hypothetical protein